MTPRTLVGHAVFMSSSQWERDALEQVLARLKERYDSVPSEIVEVTVQRVHAEFDGPVRDFVPLLVQKAARARLDRLHAWVSPAV